VFTTINLLQVIMLKAKAVRLISDCLF